MTANATAYVELGVEFTGTIQPAEPDVGLSSAYVDDLAAGDASFTVHVWDHTVTPAKRNTVTIPVKLTDEQRALFAQHLGEGAAEEMLANG